MVQPYDKRIAKYNAKYDPSVVETRFIAAETKAKADFATAAEIFAGIETDIQVVLNTDGIAQMARPAYYNFGRQIQAAINQGVADPALTALVVDILGPKYVAMGCLEATLITIALNVFSIVLPPA
jgi:hypothetical protein